MNLKLFEKVQKTIETAYVMITIRQNGLPVPYKDLVSPYYILTLCHQGSARFTYDMKEWMCQKNDMVIITPGHVLNKMECSDDFVFTHVMLSNNILSDLRTNLFISDNNRFTLSPKCMLTDQEMEQMECLAKVLKALTEFRTEELPMHKLTIFAQLVVGYNFINIFTDKHNKHENGIPNSGIFIQFSKLVVQHHTESREVQYYANMLHYTTRSLSRAVIKETGGLSPAKWIEQYVVMRAKQLITINKYKSLQEISFILGFPDPSSFYRYFKRATGITAKEFKKSLEE